MLRPRTAAVASLLFIPLVAGGFLLQKGPVQATPRLFDQVISLVAKRYVDSLQGAAIFEKAAHGLVRELNDLGVQMKGPDIGLVDFPGEVDGHPVYLCWRLGESAVAHWHERDAGFADRRPLAPSAAT